MRWRPELSHRLYDAVCRSFDPSGPKEVGGLLMGTVRKHENGLDINIRLFVPVPSSYREGRLYRLSDEDRATVRILIDRCAALQWSVVGLYRSHHRDGLHPDEEDLKLAAEYQEHSHSVFLLVGIDEAGPRAASLFLLERRKSPWKRATAVPFDRIDLKVEDDAQPLVFGAARPQSEGLTLSPLQVLTVAILFLLIAGFAGVWMLERHTPSPGRTTAVKLGLRMLSDADGLRVAWNPQASAGLDSVGTLLVVDGPFHDAIRLSPETLRAGSVVYHPHTDTATFELHVGAAKGFLSVAGLRPVTTAPAISAAESPHPAQDVPAPKASVTLLTPPQPALQPRRPPPLPPAATPIYTPPAELPAAPDLAATARTAIIPGIPQLAPYTPPAPPPQTEQISYIAARPLKRAAPIASPNALRLLVSNVAIRVRVSVDPHGRVTRAESLSGGSALIDYLSNISVKAAREWVFAPAQRGGHDVESELVLQFNFDTSASHQN